MRGSAFNRSFARSWLALGYAFLYVPIVALVVYSFNDSPVANVWRGFTLEWYRKLADDRELLAGLALSLKVALSTACASVVLGTLAAFALVRYRRFFGSTLFAGMVAAPLVMPEVIIGLSLLLMLVSLQRATEAAFGVGFPERGMLTIWLGHLLLGMAYATVVVRARLQTLNPQLEEAALDLGARPWQVFWLVTLPMIGQALLSAFLLTFTLSLDDVVLSAFLSGPGATTMPLVMPEVIIGLSLLLMLVSLQRLTEAAFGVGIPERGMLTIWFGHLLLGMAYATVVVRARLQTLNPQLEEAALDLGARPWQVFWLVTLPMIGQALLSAFLLTFTLSLDDVVLSAFLSGPGATTMPLVIFSRARLGLNPSVNAVATIIITFVAVGVVVASYLLARSERRRTLDAALAERPAG